MAKLKAPLWAKLCAIFGAILVVGSGGTIVASQVLVSRYAGAVDNQKLFDTDPAAASVKKKVVDIKGPVNLLLVGIDPRQDEEAPRSDSIIVVHVPANMSDAYMFSIPRDLLVDIPAFPQAGFRGGRDKINASMAYGSELGNGKYDVPQGFALLAKTVSQLTGIKKFDAGAIINFGGFQKIVNAMGGVTMTVDQTVKSEHLTPEGKPRPRSAACRNVRSNCDHPYIGPQKTYEPGTYHLEGWEALDYVRQRYGLKNGDYDRQRHQQQFIKAMAEQALSRDVVTDPRKLDRVLQAAGKALIFDGNGHSVVDWGLALKGVRPDGMTPIKLPGRSVIVGGDYRGEALQDSAGQFFKSVNDGTVANFLLSHPEFISKV